MKWHDEELRYALNFEVFEKLLNSDEFLEYYNLLPEFDDYEDENDYLSSLNS